MLTKFPILPGVFKDDTPLDAEGYVVDSHWMRVRRKRWQTVGGYEQATIATYAGIVRGAYAWADLSGTKAIGFGTAANLYAYYGGGILDITPQKAKGTLTNAFETATGSPIVLVHALSHGLKDGDTVTFTTADAVGGITVSGSYVVTVVSLDSYTITTGTNAMAFTTGGGSVEYSVPLDTGLVDGTGGLGYGTGAYGLGVYGIATTGDVHARVWSVQSWGNNGLFVPTNGALYEYQPQISYPELVLNGDFASSTYWFTNFVELTNPFTTTASSTTVKVTHNAHGMANGDKINITGASAVGGVTPSGQYTIATIDANSYNITVPSAATLAATGGGTVGIEQGKATNSNGWNLSGGNATATAGKASQIAQDLTGKLAGGVTYALTFTATVTAGAFQFRVVSASSTTPVDYALGETIRKSGTYTRRFTAPPNPTLIKFAKDSLFAGTIDNVSIKVESKAYRIQDAPPYARDMFVDPNRFVVLLATVEQDGDYNALCVRWCDQENNRTWTADDDNQAGEFILSLGSEIRGGKATRGQNLIWTDSALYSMRYANSTADVFRFDPIGTGCGLIHKNACIEHNGIAFWWGSSKNFHIFSGGVPQILDCPVRNDVMDNLAEGQESKITCGVNAAFNEIWWIYPDKRDGNECSRYVVFNWSENCWYVGKLARTQWVGDGVYPNPIAFGTNGTIYFHELGRSANGSPLQYELTTADFDLDDGPNLMRVSRIVPDFEDQQGSVFFEVGVKPFPNGPKTVHGPYELMASTQKRDFRHMGRQMSLRFYGQSTPAFVRFGAPKLDVTPTGAVR